MKKLILLVPILLLSCNKTESVKMSISTADTIAQNPILEYDTAKVAELLQEDRE